MYTIYKAATTETVHQREYQLSLKHYLQFTFHDWAWIFQCLRDHVTSSNLLVQFITDNGFIVSRNQEQNFQNTQLQRFSLSGSVTKFQHAFWVIINPVVLRSLSRKIPHLSSRIGVTCGKERNERDIFRRMITSRAGKPDLVR